MTLRDLPRERSNVGEPSTIRLLTVETSSTKYPARCQILFRFIRLLCFGLLLHCSLTKTYQFPHVQASGRQRDFAKPSSFHGQNLDFQNSIGSFIKAIFLDDNRRFKISVSDKWSRTSDVRSYGRIQNEL